VIDYRFRTNSMSRDKEVLFKGIMRALDQLEVETELTATERKRLRHGRRRWRHEFRPKETFGYRLEGLYYRSRAVLTVPLRSYF
jgi:hypothetical protein